MIGRQPARDRLRELTTKSSAARWGSVLLLVIVVIAMLTLSA
jgi:hypothetical protein